MPKLPVTVTDVQLRKSGQYAVTVAMADGTTQNYIIPPSLATVEAVTISALAMATLNDVPIYGPNWPHHRNRRYDPR